MVAIKDKMFTNFWGAVSPSGYYERSTDYLAIVEGDTKGFWNVPFISGAILVSAEKLQYFMESYNYDRKLDADMSFEKFCRDYVRLLNFILLITVIKYSGSFPLC